MKFEKEKNCNKNDGIQNNSSCYYDSADDKRGSVFSEVSEDRGNRARISYDIDERNHNRVKKH